MIPSHRLSRRLAVCLLSTTLVASCASGGQRVQGGTGTDVSSTVSAASTTAVSEGSTPADGSTATPTGSSVSAVGGSSTTAPSTGAPTGSISGGGTGSGGGVASTPGGGSTSNSAGSGSGSGGASATTAPPNTAAKTTLPSPQVRSWSVAYGSTPPTFTAHLGDEIVLRITSTEEQEFHVHPPYDIVLGGTTVTFDFTADQAGTKIVVESHTHPGVIVCYLTIA